MEKGKMGNNEGKRFKTEEESEMLTVYARSRLDGMSKEGALTFVIALGYIPTPLVLDAIRTQDKYIFAFNQS